MNRSRALLVLTIVLATAVVQLSGAERAGAPPLLTFTDISAGLTGVYGGSVAWGDYNSDGKLDILLTGSDSGSVLVTKIYKNNGNGTFSEDTTAESGLVGVAASSVAWGDYNSDGKPDILLTGYTGSELVSKLYKNNGNGTFSEDTTADSGLTGVWYGSVAWGDYNSDGRPDILLTGSTGSGPVSKIYKNNGNGTFSEDTTADSGLTGVYWSSVAWGDYNSDGRPDILLTGKAGSSVLVSKIYQNNGNGTFSEDTTAESGLTAVFQSSVAWGDYNSDGKPDILLTGYNGSVPVSKIYKNNGGTTFSEDTTADAGLTGVAENSVAWGDYNSDGKPDILLTGYSASGPVGQIYKNNGGTTFSEDFTADLPLSGVYGGSVAWGDYNSDGKLDILLTGYNGSSAVSSVYRNDSATVDTAPSAPASLTAAPASGSNVTLGWNAASDTQQSGGAGLSYNVRVGTTPGASNVVAPLALANGTRLVAQVGNAGERAGYTLAGLTPGATYYWSVQAIDSSFLGSGFATEGSFTMAPVFTFSAAGYSVGEADGHATVTIKRSGLTVGTGFVRFATTNGSAKAGSDYKSVSKSVIFAAGETAKTVSVPIINNAIHEKNETVRLSLANPSAGAKLGTPSSATLTIRDDDNGKLVSARLSKKSFNSSQARKVKLTYRFAPKSTSFAYRLTVKKGSKWVKVRTVMKTGSFVGKHKLTVKKIFGSKSVKSGKYRLKLSANVNSKLLKFSVS
jgi:hypothetical protein